MYYILINECKALWSEHRSIRDLQPKEVDCTDELIKQVTRLYHFVWEL